MGWLRTIFLGDIGNRLDIGDVERDLSRARMEQRQAKHALDARIVELERDNDQLKLCVAALARTMVARGVVSRDELRAVMAEIDGEDGAADGRMQGPVI